MATTNRPTFVGMVHLAALPGSPGYGGAVRPVVDAALRDAERLLAGGCDALLVENMGDLPWLRGSVPPWTVAAMTRAVLPLVALGVPVGVQILAAANREALGVAAATGATFIRVEAFAWAHVADEGWIDACAGPLLRDRAMLGAEVAVWADVQKKHSAHAVTADLSLADLAHGTAFAGADTLIATGSSTGRPTAPADLDALRSAGVPVAIGSGVTPDTLPGLRDADAVIVGSWLKEGGDWRAPVDVERVQAIRRVLDTF
jgi:hypothetical protein